MPALSSLLRLSSRTPDLRFAHLRFAARHAAASSFAGHSGVALPRHQGDAGIAASLTAATAGCSATKTCSGIQTAFRALRDEKTRLSCRLRDAYARSERFTNISFMLFYIAERAAAGAALRRAGDTALAVTTFFHWLRGLAVAGGRTAAARCSRIRIRAIRWRAAANVGATPCRCGRAPRAHLSSTLFPIALIYRRRRCACCLWRYSTVPSDVAYGDHAYCVVAARAVSACNLPFSTGLKAGRGAADFGAWRLRWLTGRSLPGRHGRSTSPPPPALPAITETPLPLYLFCYLRCYTSVVTSRLLAFRIRVHR